MWRKLVGIAIAERHLFSQLDQLRLRRIIHSLSRPMIHAPPEKRCILFVGFSKSGKRTVLQHDPFYQRCFIINTDEIHERLNRSFRWLQDDQTIEGPAYWPRQWMTNKVRMALFAMALQSGIAIVNDSCNLDRNERANRLCLAKQRGYRTEIVWVQCSETTLLQRLKAADRDNIERRHPPAWVDLYEKIQRSRFEPPMPNEADVITIKSGEAIPP